MDRRLLKQAAWGLTLIASVCMVRPSPAARLLHRSPYRARVEQELQIMAQHIGQLERRPVRHDLQPTIHTSIATLREKYASARRAFRGWQTSSTAQKEAQRKNLDSALVSMRKFYTKVLNRFRSS